MLTRACGLGHVQVTFKDIIGKKSPRQSVTTIMAPKSAASPKRPPPAAAADSAAASAAAPKVGAARALAGAAAAVPGPSPTKKPRLWSNIVTGTGPK